MRNILLMALMDLAGCAGKDKGFKREDILLVDQRPAAAGN